MLSIFAHRGWSSRYPEATRAAYRAAIEWAGATRTNLGLECDVHFSADNKLICLHDLTLHRTAGLSHRAIDLTLGQLKKVDFSYWQRERSFDDESELISLEELIHMTTQARSNGVPVSIAVETKHPNPRSLEIEVELAEVLRRVSWDVPDAPVRVISFSADSVLAMAKLAPNVPRTLLIEGSLGQWRSGHLPEGVQTAGVDINLLRSDPGFVERAARLGNQVHVWTVNTRIDIEFCLGLGVTGFTSDCPDYLIDVLGTAAWQPGP